MAQTPGSQRRDVDGVRKTGITVEKHQHDIAQLLSAGISCLEQSILVSERIRIRPAAVRGPPAYCPVQQQFGLPKMLSTRFVPVVENLQLLAYEFPQIRHHGGIVSRYVADESERVHVPDDVIFRYKRGRLRDDEVHNVPCAKLAHVEHVRGKRR